MQQIIIFKQNKKESLDSILFLSLTDKHRMNQKPMDN